MSNLNLSSFSFKPLPLVLSLQVHVKSRSPAFLYAPFSYWKAAIRLPHRLLFSGMNNPNFLSLSPQKGAPALWPCSWLSSGLASTGLCHSYAGGLRAENSTPGGVSQEWSQRGKWLPSPCWPHLVWCSPGYSWPSRFQTHSARSCWAPHQPTPSSPPQGCFLSILHPACICAQDCPNPHGGPCTWRCWTSWSSRGPTSQACQGPSGWHPFPPVCQPHHTASCHQQACWGCTQSHCPCCWQRC